MISFNRILCQSRAPGTFDSGYALDTGETSMTFPICNRTRRHARINKLGSGRSQELFSLEIFGWMIDLLYHRIVVRLLGAKWLSYSRFSLPPRSSPQTMWDSTSPIRYLKQSAPHSRDPQIGLLHSASLFLISDIPNLD